MARSDQVRQDHLDPLEALGESHVVVEEDTNLEEEARHRAQVLGIQTQVLLEAAHQENHLCRNLDYACEGGTWETLGCMVEVG